MSREVAVVALATLAVACASWVVASEDRSTLLRRAGRADGAKGSGHRPHLDRRTLAALAVAPAWLLGVRLGGPVVGIAAVGLVAAWPTLARRRRTAARTAALEEQLAEAVGVIASGLRSGRSLASAIELAGDEVPVPLGPSLRRIADHVALGEPLDAAIDAWAVEVSGPDVRVTAGVLALHRRTGGALAGALDRLAATLRARRSAARELRSLTAQARLSATILGLLPIGFFLFLSVVARDDLQTAFGSPVGSGALLLGFTLQACAYLWIRRLLRVEP